MLSDSGGVRVLIVALVADLLACEPYCPGGYEKRGDTCYKIRDSGVEGGLSDGDAASEAADGGGDVSLTDSAVGEDSAPDATMDSEAPSCADASSAACDGSETPNACDPNPCEHGGTCLSAPTEVSCDCTGTGYEGATCEVDIDECALPNTCASRDYPCVQTEPPGYTCLGQFADWPMPDAVAGAKAKPSFAVSADANTVIDQVTGLVWQRFLPPSYAGCTRGAEGAVCSWQEAKNYCDALMLGGFGDWRLPTKIELESIVDDTLLASPALDPIVFPDVPSDSGGDAWSSSQAITSLQTAAFVVLASGATFARPTDLGGGVRVRCVRGPRFISGTPATRYRINDQGAPSVSDTRTGLTWQRDLDPQSYTWSGAVAYCTGLAGGWRLPTKKELLTLIDPLRLLEPLGGRANNAIDPVIFPGSPTLSQFWSNTPAKVQGSWESGHWVVHSGGIPIAASSTELGRVRCVR